MVRLLCLFNSQPLKKLTCVSLTFSIIQVFSRGEEPSAVLLRLDDYRITVFVRLRGIVDRDDGVLRVADELHPDKALMLFTGFVCFRDVEDAVPY